MHTTKSQSATECTLKCIPKGNLPKFHSVLQNVRSPSGSKWGYRGRKSINLRGGRQRGHALRDRCQYTVQQLIHIGLRKRHVTDVAIIGLMGRTTIARVWGTGYPTAPRWLFATGKMSSQQLSSFARTQLREGSLRPRTQCAQCCQWAWEHDKNDQRYDQFKRTKKENEPESRAVSRCRSAQAVTEHVAVAGASWRTVAKLPASTLCSRGKSAVSRKASGPSWAAASCTRAAVTMCRPAEWAARCTHTRQDTAQRSGASALSWDKPAKAIDCALSEIHPK